jgi:alpha-galactosidase/6-phospho-beta-glucosidase family protein
MTIAPRLLLRPRPWTLPRPELMRPLTRSLRQKIDRGRRRRTRKQTDRPKARRTRRRKSWMETRTMAATMMDRMATRKGKMRRRMKKAKTRRRRTKKAKTRMKKMKKTRRKRKRRKRNLQYLHRPQASPHFQQPA